MAFFIRRISFRVLIPLQNQCSQCRYSSTRYGEVGQLEPVKEEGKAYEVGQLFLHKVLGYRGVIICPLRLKVFDNDKVIKREEKSQDAKTISVAHHVNGKKQTYYEVLVDDRDYPHIRLRRESYFDSGSFVDRIRGQDYVAHEDIIPYHSKEKTPIVNEYFDKVLIYDPESSPPFVMTEMLQSSNKQNISKLQLSEVHRETTENIRITAIPFYECEKQTRRSHSEYYWRYCIRLENLGEETVQLRKRVWQIMSINGSIEMVQGRGVLGEQPILSGENSVFRSYQYSSTMSLHAGSGCMWGRFEMERRNGTSFWCKIPKFSLESKLDDREDGFLGS